MDLSISDNPDARMPSYLYLNAHVAILLVRYPKLKLHISAENILNTRVPITMASVFTPSQYLPERKVLLSFEFSTRWSYRCGRPWKGSPSLILFPWSQGMISCVSKYSNPITLFDSWNGPAFLPQGTSTGVWKGNIPFHFLKRSYSIYQKIWSSIYAGGKGVPPMSTPSICRFTFFHDCDTNISLW